MNYINPKLKQAQVIDKVLTENCINMHKNNTLPVMVAYSIMSLPSLPGEPLMMEEELNKFIVKVTEEFNSLQQEQAKHQALQAQLTTDIESICEQLNRLNDPAHRLVLGDNRTTRQVHDMVNTLRGIARDMPKP